MFIYDGLVIYDTEFGNFCGIFQVFAFYFAFEVIAGAGDVVFIVVWKEDDFCGLFVYSEGAGLVARDDSTTTERLYGVETFYDDLMLCHSIRTDGESHSHSEGEAFGHGGNGEGDDRNEDFIELGAFCGEDDSDDGADNKDENGNLGGEFIYTDSEGGFFVFGL